MKVCVLSSSSNGNSVYLEVNNKKYLIDTGISLRSIRNKLSELDISLDYLDGIFLTHEHTDHISALHTISSKYRCRIYTAKDTFRALPSNIKDKMDVILFKFIKEDEVIELDGLKVIPFRTNHDAAHSFGFKFIEGDKELVYLTDTGSFTEFEKVKNADCYIIESNHEPDLLLMSSRPYHLKQRILSEIGHLSNHDSAELFTNIYGDKTKTLFLYHLSSECNSKELCMLEYEEVLKQKAIDINSFNIILTDKKERTELIEV